MVQPPMRRSFRPPPGRAVQPPMRRPFIRSVRLSIDKVSRGSIESALGAHRKDSGPWIDCAGRPPRRLGETVDSTSSPQVHRLPCEAVATRDLLAVT